MGEDYWQGKICDERRFYEDQVKVNESQFKELEVRMREYEDLLSIESNKSANNGGRLATIDEDINLEEKVVEWEEEITHLHSTIDDMEVAYEQEMSAMKQKVSSLELKQSQCKCGELSVKRRNQENDNLTQAVNEMRLKVNNTASNNKTSSSSPGCDSERKGKDAIQNS